MEEFIKATDDMIVSKLSSDRVLSKLWSVGVLTTDEYDEIQNLGIKPNRRKLLQKLKEKNDSYIDIFIDIVEECTAGQEDLVKHLKQARNSLNLKSPGQGTKLLLQDPTTADSRMFKPATETSLLQPFSPQEETNKVANLIPSMTYELKSSPRGHVLIINNITFENDSTMERRGAEKDSEALGALFRGFQMNVYSQKNVTLKNFLPMLNEFKAVFTSHPADASIVVVMSHGDSRDRILTSDQIQLQITADILQQFNNMSFPQMIGKPKIFIFQSCRGDTVDRGSLQPDSAPGPSEGKLRIPTWTDMLVCYSTLDGHYAYRHTVEGSWFIEILCNVFSTYAGQYDVCRMLNIVGEKMKEKEGDSGQKQICPWTNIGFTKDFYFLPKTM